MARHKLGPLKPPPERNGADLCWACRRSGGDLGTVTIWHTVTDERRRVRLCFICERAARDHRGSIGTSSGAVWRLER